MAYKAHLTGMLGVYQVAVELTKRGFIVSPTSRNAMGADLLVTDQACKKAWSVQVKTNSGRSAFWLVGASAEKIKSESHLYVFVNNARGKKPEFMVAQSAHVAEKTCHEIAKILPHSEFWSFMEHDRQTSDEGWELFGDPNPDKQIPKILEVQLCTDRAQDVSLEKQITI